MELVLYRKYKKAGYTIGNLYVDGERFCDTLEPTARNYAGGEQKVPGKSAIPEGRYLVVESLSKKRGQYVPWLRNVPMFECIQIHPGNTVADTQGCILVGHNREKGKVLDSQATFKSLFKKMTDTWHVHCNVYITVIS